MINVIAKRYNILITVDKSRSEQNDVGNAF